MGARKQFSEELYKDNDSPAIQAVLRYILSQGVYASVSDDKYGPDITIYDGYTKSSYVEVERKLTWKASQAEFPFPTVNLPERKLRYLRKHLSIEYWILREDLEKVAILPDYVVSQAPLVEVPNKYVPEGEYFAQVPIDECIVKSIVV